MICNDLLNKGVVLKNMDADQGASDIRREQGFIPIKRVRLHQRSKEVRFSREEIHSEGSSSGSNAPCKIVAGYIEIRNITVEKYSPSLSYLSLSLIFL